MRWLRSGILQWVNGIRHQIAAIAATYALFLNGYLMVYFWIGEQNTLIKLLNYVAFWLLLGNCLGALILMSLSPFKHWKLYPWPALLVGGWWYGGLLLPPDTPPYRADFITVATYNVTGLQTNQAIRLAIVDALDADMLALQEIGLSSQQMLLLAELYPYMFIAPGGSSGLLSRYPIMAGSLIEIFEFHEGRAARIAGFRVLIDYEGQPIAVYVFHPTRPIIELRPMEYDDQGLQMAYDQLLASISQETYPIILMCDCNVNEVSSRYREMQAIMDDAWQRSGWGIGLTATAGLPQPVFRSDFILVSPAIQVQQVKVWYDNGGSDHYPVRAELQLPN